MEARPYTWDKYEDAMELELENKLCDVDVRNGQKRELNEAMLLVAAENTDWYSKNSSNSVADSEPYQYVWLTDITP